MGQFKNKNLNKTVGSRVSGARQNAGFATSAAFAGKCDIDHQTMRSIECGSVTVNVATLKTMAEKCGVSADYLLGLTETKTPNVDIKATVEKYGLSEAALGTLALLRSTANSENYTLEKEGCIEAFDALDALLAEPGLALDILYRTYHTIFTPELKGQTAAAERLADRTRKMRMLELNDFLEELRRRKMGAPENNTPPQKKGA